MNTKQLRQKILDLAIKGKLVPQDPNDEPASKLLERIREEKEQLIKEGKLKRDKNESFIFVGDDKLHYEKFADGSVVCIEDEIPFEIPENWAWCRLKEVGIINPKNKAEDDICAGFIPMPLIPKEYLKKTKFQKKTWKEIKKGFTHFQNNDVVVAKITPCFENSKAAIITDLPNNIGAGTTELHVIRPINILPEYIYGIIKSKQFLTLGKQEMTGCAGQQRVPTSFVEDYLIPIPPQSEQVRISSTVQELLEIVEAIENDKIDLSELIKQTKAKVLDLAIKGKLVPQNPEDEPADILLEKIREEKENLIKEGKLKRDKNETFIFKNSDDNSYYEQINGETVCIDDDLPFEIPDTWRWTRLRNVSIINPKNKAEDDICAGFIPMPLIPKEYLKKTKFQKKTWKEIKKGFTHFQNNDVVVAKITPCFENSKAAIITDLPNNIGAGTTELHVIRPINILPEYIYGIIKSKQFLTLGKQEMTGCAGQQRVPTSFVEDYLIPIPPYNDQHKIANRIKEIFSKLDCIELIIKGS